MTIYVGIKNDRFNEGTGWFVANDVNQGQVFNVGFYSSKFSPDINLNHVKMTISNDKFHQRKLTQKQKWTYKARAVIIVDRNRNSA